MSCLSIDSRQKILEWTKECTCNFGKPNFEAIEFNTNNSRMEIVCGACHSIICWWPISTEQVVPISDHRTQKSLAIPARTTD
jgi:hypothetical protein